MCYDSFGPGIRPSRKGEGEMKLGMIGLGRMGVNMIQRLLKGGHQVVGYARRPESVKRVEKLGAEGAYALDELVLRRGATWFNQ